ncbi:uncharacterized protein I303_100361 [Kwoniella dejecticola CBS 10117]|uniref:Gfo/Idh/MocA-like oxidoreductase N-terminal domain-containing protein n=1 Tax=Kwoniella dejecticola CBS 10117 TaxID=1296121 RepID=A0A1A6AER8_9TREE|nr:uncharacterized protein I303_00361 [Kwoniella dejecticola CBS 10117]OBR88544.1 hypothetical protein I303_00361 [Kwoniella dejecticola CBS 10117]
MPDSPIKIALLGTGIYSESDYLPSLLKETQDHSDVKTVWSLDASAAERFAVQFQAAGRAQPQIAVGDAGIEEIINDAEIDAVVIVLPFAHQPPLIKRFWAAGKHVLSEKPIERDVKAGLALVKEFDENWKSKNLVWRVAEDYDHEPIHRRAAELLADPAMGPVLFWDLQNQNYCPDGDKWQSTTWRNVPDYQGGFCLDGGVHSIAMLRVILPDPPAAVVSSASLHRKHTPPHDTILALVLPASSATKEPSGSTTKLDINRLQAAKLPEPGKSTPAGTITFTWALPDIEPRPPKELQVLNITCLNGKLTLINDSGTRILEVSPANGSRVKAVKETSAKKGVEVELAYFARAVQATKAGRAVDPAEDYGTPINTVWDVAVIQAMLQSNGNKVDIQQLIDQYK